MMRCTPFAYRAPTTVEEVLKILAGEGKQAMLLAGGTDLVPNMKRRQQTPATLVSLKRVAPLRGLRHDGGVLSIGAMSTLSAIAEAAPLAPWAALRQAAAQVATPHIRNAGTVGGNLCLDTRCNYYDQSYEWRQAIDFCMKKPGDNGVARPRDFAAGASAPAATDGAVLPGTATEGARTKAAPGAKDPAAAICWVAPGSPRCWAVSSTDCAPALLALGGEVTLASASGARTIALADLYRDDGIDYLARRPDELVTEVRLPDARGWRSTYWKLRRRDAFDFPVLGVAAAVKLDGAGRVEDARLVFGAVASRPLAVAEAHKLVGEKLDDALIDSVAEAASRHAKPLDNTDFQLGWRKRVARSFVAGALRELRGDDPASLGLLARRQVALRPL